MRGDLAASLTVTAVAVPQAMGYAMIAGLPPMYGLYTGIVTCAVGSLMRSSRFLITGPTNATAMVVFHTLQPYIDTSSHVQMCLLLTFLAGFIQVAFGMMRLSGVVRYVSNSVVVGIMAGASLLIAGNQLRNFFGLEDVITRADMQTFVVGLGKVFWTIGVKYSQLDLPMLPAAIGFFTIFFIYVVKKVNPRLPGPLMAVTLSALAVYLFKWNEQGVRTIQDLGSIPRNLNIFMVPEPVKNFDFGAAGDLFSGAIAVSILGLIEATSIAKNIAAKSGERIDFQREFIAQGTANLCGAFCSCFVGSGSFTRSAINYESGARTRLAGVFSAAMTALTVVIFAPLANWIPIASLAGLLIFIAVRMVEGRQATLSWRSGWSSRLTLLATFGSTIFFNLQWGIYVGVFCSIVFLLRATGEPTLKRILMHDDGDVEQFPADSAASVETPVAMIDLTGDFYFAAVQDLDLKLRHAIPSGTRVLVLRMREMRTMGSTGIEILSRFCRDMRSKGITVILGGVEQDLERLIRKSGLQNEIGEENIFYADNIVYRATALAFARARTIIEASETGEGRGAPVNVADLRARDLMQPDSIRFGITHRLREALWLFREGRKRRKNMKRLFLQGDDARIAGAIDLRRVLYQFLESALKEDKDATTDRNMEDWESVRHIWGRIHRRKLSDVARQKPRTVSPNSTLAEVCAAIHQRGVYVIPVEEDGRVIGQIHLEDIISALRRQAKGDQS